MKHWIVLVSLTLGLASARAQLAITEAMSSAAAFLGNPEISSDVYFSTAMNSKLIDGGALTIKVASLLRPVSTVVFQENRLPDEAKVDASQSGTDLGQPASYASRFSARHRGAGNLVFADGHAQAFKGNQVVETRAGNPNKGKAILPQDQVIWTADPTTSPN